MGTYLWAVGSAKWTTVGPVERPPDSALDGETFLRQVRRSRYFHPPNGTPSYIRRNPSPDCGAIAAARNLAGGSGENYSPLFKLGVGGRGAIKKVISIHSASREPPPRPR
ncbi:Hypothetical protein NTJ_07128 [Nesidiocoris tenuis]|uniref:Uncharacterized protein n=1 Tax=Nesidiocoris tenuis TaxID=355587 RepID=A0ABN7ASR7_9HEMI|nr:Hypothetical protein NTJ_07128 [Nesidiocoris tenuis]